MAKRNRKERATAPKQAKLREQEQAAEALQKQQELMGGVIQRAYDRKRLLEALVANAYEVLEYEGPLSDLVGAPDGIETARSDLQLLLQDAQTALQAQNVKLVAILSLATNLRSPDKLLPPAREPLSAPADTSDAGADQ